MDPDALLAALLNARRAFDEFWNSIPEGTKLSQSQTDHLINLGVTMSEAVEALDAWLASGGFRPKRWAVA